MYSLKLPSFLLYILHLFYSSRPYCRGRGNIQFPPFQRHSSSNIIQLLLRMKLGNVILLLRANENLRCSEIQKPLCLGLYHFTIFSERCTNMSFQHTNVAVTYYTDVLKRLYELQKTPFERRMRSGTSLVLLLAKFDEKRVHHLLFHSVNKRLKGRYFPSTEAMSSVAKFLLKN